MRAFGFAFALIAVVLAGCSRQEPNSQPSVAPPAKGSPPPPSASPAPSVAPQATRVAVRDLASGDYDGLLLHVDPSTGLLTGTFRSETGWDDIAHGPQFSCWVDFVARFKGEPAVRVRLQSEESPIQGTLTALSPTSFRLHLDEEPGGCWNVDERFSKAIVEKGTAFALTANAEPPPGPCRVVRVPRASLRARPQDEASPRYVVRLDRVFVLESKDDWRRVEYRDGAKDKVTGWVREADLVAF